MNILALDIGNSDIKLGLFQKGELRKFWRASELVAVTHHKRPEDFSNILRSSLAPVGTMFDGLVYSTVVPEVEPVLKKTIQYCFNIKHPLMAVKPGVTKLPIEVERYPINQLGTDRLVSACGAFLMYPDKNMILVDFGTATTFDVVSADGRFLGGAITPGVETFTEILHFKTSLLPKVPMTYTPTVLGNSTVECLQAGISFGYRGLVKEIIQRLKAELAAQYQIVDVICLATGGGAESFINANPDDAIFSKIEPTLTIKGLYAIYMDALKQHLSRPALPKTRDVQAPSAPSVER